MMKTKWFTALLLICFLTLPLSAFAADPGENGSKLVTFSRQAIEVAGTAPSFSVDIVMGSHEAFSGAEFGVQLTGNIQLKSVAYNASIDGSTVRDTLSNGIHYFGFFGTTNKYGGGIAVCTLTFDYAGNLPAAVTLKETNLTTVTPTGGANKASLFPNATVQITRAAGNVDPGTPGNPGGTDTPGGIAPNPDAQGRYTYIIDDVAALTALEAADSGAKSVTFAVPSANIGKAQEIAVRLPYFLLNQTERRNVVIQTPLGSVTLPDHAIPQAQLGNAQTLTLVIGKVNASALPAAAQQSIGGRPVIDLHMELNGQTIAWRNDNAPATVAIPYAPTSGELASPERIVIAYVDGSGSVQIMPTSRYHAESGMVTFNTTHFSTYGVALAGKTFEDTATSWARSDIEALATRGIISGTSATRFSPGANITRADFAKLLVGVLGKPAAAAEGTGFRDVPTTAYYYDAVMTAQSLGLASGANGAFNPKAPITRQDMMVLLDRALAVAGKPLEKSAALTAFKDAKQVAGYAKPSVEKLLASGIISGSNGSLRPLAPLTRAEAAKVLHLLYNELY